MVPRRDPPSVSRQFLQAFGKEPLALSSPCGLQSLAHLRHLRYKSAERYEWSLPRSSR
jgi:hypothetical protein